MLKFDTIGIFRGKMIQIINGKNNEICTFSALETAEICTFSALGVLMDQDVSFLLGVMDDFHIGTMLLQIAS